MPRSSAHRTLQGFIGCALLGTALWTEGKELSAPPLQGNQMVEDSRRRTRNGNGLRHDGTVPVGKLSARLAGSDAKQEKVLGLRALTVNAAIEGLAARTTVTHVFQNETDSLLEGVFTFDLPSGVAVDRFAMTIQSESDLMEASLVEQGQAHQIYTQLVYGNTDPGILEYVGDHTFKATVFPIPPRGTKTIVVSYIQMLSPRVLSDGTRRIEYCFPLTNGADAPLPASEVRLTGLLAGLPKGSKLDSTLDTQIAKTGEGAAKITGTLTAAKITGQDWTVAIHTPPVLPEGLERTWMMPAPAFASNGTGLFQAHRAPGSNRGVFALTVTPEASITEAAENIEVVFMVDTSANRTQAEISASAAMIDGVLASLEANDRFSIVAFDILPRVMTAELLRPSTDNRAKAMAFLKSAPPMGATDIAAAFEAVTKTFGSAGMKNPSIVFIGDGQATFQKAGTGSVADAIETTMKTLHAELLCVGQGDPAQDGSMTTLATKSGACLIRMEAESRPVDVGRDVALRLGTPMVRHAKFEIRRANASVGGEPLASAVFAREFAGGLPLNVGTTLFGEFTQAEPVIISLTGSLAGKPYKKDWRIDLPQTEPANAVLAKLFAREKLSMMPVGPDATKLATEHNLLSRGLAFLVLESEQMYRDFAIKRDGSQKLAPEKLHAKFLAARDVTTPAVQTANAPGTDGEYTESRIGRAVKNLNVGTAAPRVSLMAEPIEIEGVWVKVSLNGAEVLEKQGKAAPLNKSQVLERRLGLSRLIAGARQLPFEPETVFPAVWMDALTASIDPNPFNLLSHFSLASDDKIWAKVHGQPEKKPELWRNPLVATNIDEEHIRRLMIPQKPTRFDVAANDAILSLDSHEFAHQIVASLLEGKPAKFWKGQPTDIRRAQTTRKVAQYNLVGVQPTRLSAVWNFLAQMAMVEGQLKDAESFFAKSVARYEEATATDPSSKGMGERYATLFRTLTVHLRADMGAAARGYQKLVESVPPLDPASDVTIFRALTQTLPLASDAKLSVQVLEAWRLKEPTNKMVMYQLGRAYVFAERPLDAMRAFSSDAEFDVGVAGRFNTPEAFLKRFNEIAPKIDTPSDQQGRPTINPRSRSGR